MTIGQFREKYNAINTTLQIAEYRAIDNRGDKSNLTRAASKINENLYASTALEQGTGKIKTLQITWLPVPGTKRKRRGIKLAPTWPRWSVFLSRRSMKNRA